MSVAMTTNSIIFHANMIELGTQINLIFDKSYKILYISGEYTIPDEREITSFCNKPKSTRVEAQSRSIHNFFDKVPT